MLNCQKDKFNIPPNVSYINVAYMAPNLKAVETAGIDGVKMKSQPWEVTRPHYFEPVAQLKKTFAQLINAADSDRIALIPSASYGIASAVKNIPATSKNNIILADEGFPSNYYSWKRLAEASGAELRIISPEENQFPHGRIWNEKIINAIDENTIAVSVGNVHWADGTLFDLKKIREKTNEFGAYLIVDGTQSVGALPLDIQELELDALICASYKWLFGSYTFGVAYYGEKFDNGIPIEENWINRLDSDQFENLVNYQSEYKPKANRFMMGQQSNFIGVPMLQTSLDQLLEWGVENIQNYCKNLSEKPIQKLLEMGCAIEEDAFRANHLFGVRLAEKMDMEKLKSNFQKENVFLSQRGNAIRIAPHLYNTEEDFNKLTHCFENAFIQKTVF